MKILMAFLLAVLPLCLHAQKVELRVYENFAEVSAEQTQTELKPGWIVFDIKMKDKLTRYLNGAHSAQLTDDNRPVFRITPGADEVLTDYALIRLQGKRYYRKLPKSNLRENEYRRIEPAHFHIKSDGKEGFLCQPSAALEKGDYILLNIAQKPVGELEDLKVYPFTVP